MGFIKAKYFVPFFMLVLLTSGFPLNANNDGDILPTADAAVKAPNNGNKIFFCENNPINENDAKSLTNIDSDNGLVSIVWTETDNSVKITTAEN